MLNDGLIQLKVLEIDKNKINTIVIIGGELSNNKGINRLGGSLSASVFTDKDKQDLKTAEMIGVYYIAVSFPRNAVNVLVKHGGLKKADQVIFTHGDYMEIVGASNTLKILTI